MGYAKEMDTQELGVTVGQCLASASIPRKHTPILIGSLVKIGNQYKLSSYQEKMKGVVMTLRGSVMVFLCLVAGMMGCKRQQGVNLDGSDFKQIDVIEEFSGSYSGIKEKKELVIQDETEWENLWRALNSIREPLPETPVVDFTTQSVIAVFQGEQRTGGYGIEITQIKQRNDTLYVNIHEKTPSEGGMVTMALTQPYHIVVVPKIDAAPVRFSRQNR